MREQYTEAISFYDEYAEPNGELSKEQLDNIEERLDCIADIYSSETPGQRLSRLLSEEGLSQHSFANLCGYTPQAINRIIKGHTAMTRDAAHIFADKLGVYDDYLLGEQLYPKKKEGITDSQRLGLENWMTKSYSEIIKALPENEMEIILGRYCRLSDEGRKELRHYLELLLQIPKFQRDMSDK